METVEVRAMLGGMCRAVEAVDGDRFATYFAEDGVYHDDFYGAFERRARIAELINQYFAKHASNMRWDRHSAPAKKWTSIRCAAI